MSRWFRVSADIFEHELFAQSEMSEREAFLWLVAKAAWKDTRHRIGANMVPVPRGSLFVTLRELCSAWGWKSDHKVRTFLDVLERERMIEKDAGAGKTRVTICNYDKYQNSTNDAGASEAQEGRSEGALKIPEYQDTSLRSVSKSSPRAKPEAGVSILLDAGVKPETLADWQGVRKAKKAGPITETVATGLIREAKKAGMSAQEAVQMAAERGWQGFNAEWAKNSRAGPSQHPPPQRRGSAALFDAMDRIFPDEPDSKTIPASAIFQLTDLRQR